VLAEFGYGGKLLPSFPQWVINGQKVIAPGLGIERKNPATDLLEGNAQRQRVDG
jgi:hypothetical protein